MQEQQLTLTNASGLHARPAKNFVQLAKSFESTVTISKDGKSYNGKSLMKILQAGLTENDVFTLQVEGGDEAEALQAMVSYITNLDE